MIFVDILSWISVGVLACGLLVLAANAATAPRMRRGDHARAHPKVSVLVPCRDEERNVDAMLEAWSRVEYADWELVVLDDGSTDRTPELLSAWTKRNPRLATLRGSRPPDGWTGKNWACQQLARAAGGEILVFADADVLPRPEALESTVAVFERERADAVSGFGRQRTRGWAEIAVVPLVMELPLSAFLPMRLAVQRPEPALAAAVGQWFAFRRGAYDAIGGHASVASRIVEDVALARAAKRRGMRLVPAVAHEVLDVEMYRGLRETWRGFSKNISRASGGGILDFLAVQGPGSIAFLLPWVLATSGRIPSLLSLALLASLRAGSALFWRRPLAHVLWHPVGSALFLGAGIRSSLATIWPVAWKGRIPCPADNAKPS